MREILNDILFVIALTGAMVGLVWLFVRTIKSTGRDYAEHIRKMRAAKENSANYIARNLAGLEQQNALLKRIADALDRAYPPPKQNKDET